VDLTATVRALAILLGLLLLSAAILDIVGLVQYSDETPPLARRAAHSFPLALAGGLLAIPYRLVVSRGLRIAAACGLVLVVAWALYVSASGVADYVRGLKSWHVVPSGILFATVAIANLWAFLRITAHGRRP
jgi:hypothetical protein